MDVSQSDILRPQLLWLGTRCFRVLNKTEQDKPQMLETLENVNTPQEFPDADSNLWNIEFNQNSGVYQAFLPVPSVCYGFIIGIKNKNRSEIESTTKTKIIIPRRGMTGNVVVSGASEEAVFRACDRIMLKVSELRAKSKFTHFVCIPCNGPEIQENFESFKREVLQQSELDEMLFQSPMKLHLTLGMLTLFDDAEVSKASQLLQEITKTKITPLSQASPVTFKLKGIDTMQDDPQNVDVLYGCVENGSSKKKLESIGNSIITSFVAAGFSFNKDPVKLHATLINSSFKMRKLKEQDETIVPRRSQFSFNATKIFENFKHFEFGTVTTKQLRLSVIGSISPSDGAHSVVSEHAFAD